jgi:hypothetical protein
MKPKTLILTLLILAVYLLHQDSWNWKTAEPLVLGFLPIGLAYHAGYSILAAILMAILVKFAWPKHLEDVQPQNTDAPREEKETH